MRAQSWSILLILGLLTASLSSFSTQAVPLAQSIPVPVLEWQRGGCTSWCETGWYSSPAVADLDGDGTMEVIGATYTVYALNGEDGSVQW
ncbi:MAG: VCBS repeat-containing protein, partial [Anaerolineae bacterium]|nr:VCBS repeat-containing protein [Anaerolineae bacterium]